MTVRARPLALHGPVAVHDELPGGGRQLEATEARPPPEADGVPGVGEVGTAGASGVVEAGEGAGGLREVLTTSGRGLKQFSILKFSQSEQYLFTLNFTVQFTIYQGDLDVPQVLCRS